MIWILAISLLSAVLYRLGGKGGAWWANTKVRDLGCGLCVLACAWVVGFTPSVWWILSWLLMWGALSTYHSWFKRLIGEDSASEFWYNYFLHGLFIGIAFLPVSLSWLTVIRAVILGAFMSTSVLVKKDWLDEGLRGFYICLTILFFI